MQKYYKISNQSIERLKEQFLDFSQELSNGVGFMYLNSMNALNREKAYLDSNNYSNKDNQAWYDNEIKNIKEWKLQQKRNAKQELFDIFDFIYQLRCYEFEANTNYIVDFNNKKIIATATNNKQVKPKIQNMAYRYSLASDYYSKTLEVNIPKLFIEENKQDEIEK